MIELKIKEGVTVEIKGNEVETKGSLGSNKRKFNDALLKLTKKGDSITIDSIKDKVLAKKAAKAEVSFKKELENDMHGVTEHFERKMKTVFAHFPITVEVKGSDVLIKNLIGERYPRTSKIVGATKVEVKGQNLRIYGTSLDDVTQTSANIRQVCKMKNKDTRVFQDGLYYDTD
ncbi:MAG: 50S ribosomal protein L6 [Candidatus Micrarchaeaceae archaeon]|jgi:large subunit ribosomal protein L6